MDDSSCQNKQGRQTTSSDSSDDSSKFMMKPKFSKKHLKPSDGSSVCFTGEEQKEFEKLYPSLIICGKQSEYYKV